jgi:hypothetical protein
LAIAWDASGGSLAKPVATGLVQNVVQDEYGVTISGDQARCLLDTVTSVDASALYAALYTCGVDLLDLPSG